MHGETICFLLLCTGQLTLPTVQKRNVRKIINNGAEFVIINYDGVEIVKDEIANGGFDLFIVDEATHYKNAQTKRWKTLNKLIGEDDWLWMMTGTPAAQSPLGCLWFS